jgi:teichuronic acid biosynthesis glycosyltransferase TuaG
MNPLVSVVMPAYNAEKYIFEAIQSVVNQTYQNWELIVVDDCSTDNTKAIIETFANQDKRIKPIYLDKNGGKPSIVKNVGLKKVSGEYIAFLDSDDVWMKEKLEIQIIAMQTKRAYGLCYTGGYWIDSLGQKIKSFLPQYDSGQLFKKMLRRYEINNQSVMITKQALENTLTQFNEVITIGEDYNLFMHILSKYDAIVIKQYLIKYRIHEDAITKRKKRVSDGVLVTLKELDLFSKFPLYAIFTYLKAIRFKYLRKKWQ